MCVFAMEYHGMSTQNALNRLRKLNATPNWFRPPPGYESWGELGRDFAMRPSQHYYPPPPPTYDEPSYAEEVHPLRPAYLARSPYGGRPRY